MSDPLRLAAALAALLAVAVAVGVAAGLGQGRVVLTAAARAAVQLAAVGLVLVVVLTTPGLAPLYLLSMVAVAAVTSGRRLRRVPRAALAAGVAISAGAAVPALVVAATGALPLTVRALVPFTAQVVGGAMTATTLAGARLLDDVDAGWHEVEGWLALGATGPQAVAGPARRAAAGALVPALDQTASVGLVTLPGAYVGLLLAGASPVEAGRVQLLVLVGLVCAETVCAVVVTRLLARRVGDRRPVR